jgi:hypothetical protein
MNSITGDGGQRAAGSWQRTEEIGSKGAGELRRRGAGMQAERVWPGPCPCRQTGAQRCRDHRAGGSGRAPFGVIWNRVMRARMVTRPGGDGMVEHYLG